MTLTLLPELIPTRELPIWVFDALTFLYPGRKEHGKVMGGTPFRLVGDSVMRYDILIEDGTELVAYRSDAEFLYWTRQYRAGSIF